jgi:hypothetical protein
MIHPPSISPRKLLPRQHWQARATAHAARVTDWADRFIERRDRGQKHPVEDFLFTYYNFPPGKLKPWFPALSISLEVKDEDLVAEPHLQQYPAMTIQQNIAALDPTLIPTKTRALATWVAELCQRVLDRPARFRCFGLHEWAMVYQQTADQIRHQGYELRLLPTELASFVESQALCCTHYDAFRFFTHAARPLNAFSPTLDTRQDHEQGACLHANMDLYKWATKLWPWIGSDLVGEAFALAIEGRILDMRASPYRLTHLGYEPITIETAEGRQHYENAQRALAEKSRPLRQRLALAAADLAQR